MQNSMNIFFTIVFVLFSAASGLNVLEFTIKLTRKFTNIILDNSGENSECTFHLKEVLRSFVNRERWGVESEDLNIF